MTTLPGCALRTALAAEWPWSPERRAEVRRLARELSAVPTRAALHAGGQWPRQAAQIDDLLGPIQTGRNPGTVGNAAQGAGAQARVPPGVPRSPEPAAPAGARRVVHWNILKGIAFEGIARALTDHAALRGADVVLLSEVDVGMARSSNRHVACDLAERLGTCWAYVPSYLELTKGPGRDARAPGENDIGLHGVAILTRERPLALAAITLPEIFDYFPHVEKRVGQRQGLMASLPDGWVVGSVHLEVRNTPAARASQLAAFLDGVESFCVRENAAGRPVRRVLLGGDLNTHTFARGSLWRGTRGFLRLLLTPRERLWRQLLRPWIGGRERLFADLARRGYAWEPLSEDLHTAWAPLHTIEEAQGSSRLLDPLLAHALGPERRGLPLRLDWFMGRGVCVAKTPAPVRTLVDLLDADPAPSDHAPLVLECAR
jgi:endonuclease/exonuclease/phosphatase family metal-dependent hydrolase